MRVVVTGAGLVGCRAARWLVERGDDVAMVDVAPDHAYVARAAGTGVPVDAVDVRDRDRLTAAIAARRPEVVVHTVALMSSLAQSSPLDAVAVNVGGTANVAGAARVAGARRVVHVSTLGVHDLSRPQGGPITEDFPTGGSTRVYPATKVAAEHVLRALAGAFGFELAMLRIGAVYGDGHFRGGSNVGIAVRDVVTAALARRPAVIGGGLAAVDELVYVEDVAHGVALAVHADRLPHDTYNVGAGALTTTDDLARAVADVVPGASTTAGDPRPDPHPRRQPMSLERARAELGYEPRYDLRAGLRAYADELRSGA